MVNRQHFQPHQAQQPGLMSSAAAAGDEDAVELVTFTSTDDAYVYAPLPAATSYGHRAETWNPDKWLQEVKVKVVTCGDSCFVRMLSKDTGELFAECPLPCDGTPLTTAVEPVVDSSRYFVTRVVDRESRRHAFIGMGFRGRGDASDFAAALDEYRQYLRRKQEAEQLRQEFSQLEASQPAGAAAAAGSIAGSDGSSGGTGAEPGQQQQQQAGLKDFSLKPGQTIHINLAASLKRTGSGNKPAGSSTPVRQGSCINATPSPATSGAAGAAGEAAAAAAVPRLAPPGSSTSSSSSGFFRLQPPPPSGAAVAAVGAGVLLWPQHVSGNLTQQQQQQQEQCAKKNVSGIAPPSNPASPQAGKAHSTVTGPTAAGSVAGGAGRSGAVDGAPAAAAAGAAGAAAAAVEDDDWGDFVG